MRKNDFIKIAETLNATYRATTSETNQLRLDSIFLHQAKDMAKVLSTTNPKFDTTKFLALAMK